MLAHDSIIMTLSTMVGHVISQVTYMFTHRCSDVYTWSKYFTHTAYASHAFVRRREPTPVADLPGLWSQAGDAQTKSVWPEQAMGCLLQHASRIYIHTCTYRLISTCIHSNDLHVCSIVFIEGGRHVCGRTVRVCVHIRLCHHTNSTWNYSQSRSMSHHCCVSGASHRGCKLWYRIVLALAFGDMTVRCVHQIEQCTRHRHGHFEQLSGVGSDRNRA